MASGKPDTIDVVDIDVDNNVDVAQVTLTLTSILTVTLS